MYQLCSDTNYGFHSPKHHAIPLVWHQVQLTQTQERSLTGTQLPPPRQEGGKGGLGLPMVTSHRDDLLLP